jgi:ribulose-phosphate 3-epimerase
MDLIPAVAKIAPSVLGADFAHLADDIAGAENAGAQMFHLDIMDGHFVPNLSFGPGIVKVINRLTEKFLDVHLMLSEPEKYFKPFVKAGADSITFHLEVHPDPARYAREIREYGIKAGISINPDMPVERVLPFLESFDFLLIMSVFPGFGGQQFMPSALPKIAAARKFIDGERLKTQIEVDGGIDESNLDKVVGAGADILVMGTGFFGHKDREEIVRKVSAGR